MQADIKVLISRVAQNLRIQEIWHFKNNLAIWYQLNTVPLYIVQLYSLKKQDFSHRLNPHTAS